MKVLIQIVKSSRVEIAGECVGQINHGALYFVAFHVNDTPELVAKMVEKVLKLRIFPDENGKTNLTLKQVNGAILSVSQFTLYADVSTGNRPSFTASMNGEKSSVLYDYFNHLLTQQGYQVEMGRFGADMQVSLTNDGPFTILVDSDEIYG